MYRSHTTVLKHDPDDIRIRQLGKVVPWPIRPDFVAISYATKSFDNARHRFQKDAFEQKLVHIKYSTAA